MQLSDVQVFVISQYGFPFVVAGAIFLYRHLVSKLPEQKRQTVERIVHQAVQAVEQAQALVPGQVKKEYAVNLIGSLLERAGVKATPEQIDTLIEAAVYSLNSDRSQSTKVVPSLK